jgi:hypothetical protein
LSSASAFFEALDVTAVEPKLQLQVDRARPLDLSGMADKRQTHPTVDGVGLHELALRQIAGL